MQTYWGFFTKHHYRSTVNIQGKTYFRVSYIKRRRDPHRGETLNSTHGWRGMHPTNLRNAISHQGTCATPLSAFLPSLLLRGWDCACVVLSNNARAAPPEMQLWPYRSRVPRMEMSDATIASICISWSTHIFFSSLHSPILTPGWLLTRPISNSRFWG